MISRRKRIHRFAAVIVASLFVGVLSTGCQTAHAQQGPPIETSDFREIAPQGFGDRQNSWAWSMEWFQGKLYVGTLRSHACLISAALSLAIPQYPPSDPDIECTDDSRALPISAEIWAWTPETETWALAYRSPMNVYIPGSTFFTARDIGFRGMQVFTEPGGEEALYVGACSARAIYPWAPSGRILRSTDGTTFTPVPQDPGSFMGNLGNTCFRGMTILNDQLFVLAGNFPGEGSIIASSTPWLGNDTFRQITPVTAQAYELAAFEDELYVLFDHPRGFGVYKTDATGPLPYQFERVFDQGGYKTPRPNRSALSMKVFKERLYIGGNSVQPINDIACILNILCGASVLANGGAELFRVAADGTWDLVAGQSRNTPVGPKPAISGYGPGFNWPLNQHIWRMEVFDDRLYVGTFDAATDLRAAGGAIDFLRGFDLWMSDNGVNFQPVNILGLGDGFNHGVRSLLATPVGLFLGTANSYYGTKIYLADPR